MAIAPRALVVGGTGPTGPYVLQGLVDRGFDVLMLHTGRHELDSVPSAVEHLHTDPFDEDQLAAALRGKHFDVAVVMYGRLRSIAALLRGRAGRFVSVGGIPAYRGFGAPDRLPLGGLGVPTREDAPRAAPRDGAGGDNGKITRIVQSEDAVFTHHPAAFHLRFPIIYGPRQLLPREWMVVRRVLDRRSAIILPDGGPALLTMAYVENAAHAILCAVDEPGEEHSGVYNVSDEWTPSLRQWVTLVAGALGHRFEIVGIPFDLASISWPLGSMNDPWHRVFPADRAIYRLGYRDVVPVEEALARTARWLVEHPPSGADGIASGDRFDYAAEDELIARWRQAIEPLQPLADRFRALGALGARYAPDFDRTTQLRPGEWALLHRGEESRVSDD
jgi:nucleoside-diphosphate-sugar epimerase